MGRGKPLRLVIILFATLIVSATPRNPVGEQVTGCTSKFLLPDRPFIVVWNKPSYLCEKYGIHLNLSKWDIVDNKNDAFAGDNSIIYYQLGHWPRLNTTTGAVVSNGGVPQRGNLLYHLKEAQAQVENSTKPGFDGVAVIDMENWRPIFHHNFDSFTVYKKVSIEIAKKRHPHLNKTALKEEAAREFETAARSFLENTLNLTYDLRPGGHWGFYGFPRNWGQPGVDNDRLAYLWRASKGLYPRIYMQDHDPYPDVRKYIWGQVNETLRVWAKFSSPDTLILPYSLCQDNGTNFFSKDNLSLAVGLPGKMGAAGVVIWGSHESSHTLHECRLLQKYVNTTLGPYVKNLTQFLSDCSISNCNAHGRCVDKHLEAMVQQHRRDSNQKQCLIREQLFEDVSGAGGYGSNRRVVDDLNDPPQPYKDYVCRCLPGWTGDHCEKKA